MVRRSRVARSPFVLMSAQRHAPVRVAIARRVGRADAPVDSGTLVAVAEAKGAAASIVRVATLAAGIVKGANDGLLETIGRGDHVATATNVASEVAVASDEGGVMMRVRAAVADSVIVTRAAFRERRASVKNGPIALTACATPVVRAAMWNDGIPAHRRLDRGDRRRHVQWEE